MERQGLTTLKPGYSFSLDQYDLYPPRQPIWRLQAYDLLQSCGHMSTISTKRKDESFTVPYNPVL